MCPASTAISLPRAQNILMLLARRSAELCPIPVLDADLDHDKKAVMALYLESQMSPVHLGSDIAL
jgi:hypothetical protein